MLNWDWKKAKEKNSPLKLKWLKENYNKEGLTEKDYMTAMEKIYKEEERFLHPRRRRREYRYFQKKYGFFPRIIKSFL